MIGRFEESDPNIINIIYLEITDEMRAEVVSTESTEERRAEIFTELQSVNAEIMAKYEAGLPAGELRQKYDNLEREFRMLCDEQ